LLAKFVFEFLAQLGQYRPGEPTRAVALRALALPGGASPFLGQSPLNGEPAEALQIPILLPVDEFIEIFPTIIASRYREPFP
jgi:hypothetical protein